VEENETPSDPAETPEPLPTEQAETVVTTAPSSMSEGRKLKVFMASTIVLAVILIGVVIVGAVHHDHKKAMKPAPFGLRGRAGAPGAFGGGGPGGFGGGPGGGAGGRLDLKSQFFTSDGSINSNAVTDFVNTLPAANRSQIVSRIEFGIDRSVSAGKLTSDEGTKLRAALDSAAGVTTTTVTS